MDIYCLLRERRTARKAIMNTGGMNKTFLYFTCDSGRLPSGQISRQGDTHNQDRAKAKVLRERKTQTHKWRYLILVLNLNRPQPCVPYAEMDSSPLHPFIQLQYVSICEWFLLVHFISHAFPGVIAPPWCFAPLDRRGIMSRGAGDAFHPDLEREVPLGNAMPPLDWN